MVEAEIRPLDLDRPGEAESVAALMGWMFRRTLTAEELIRRTRDFPSDRPAIRLVAAVDGTPVGYGRACYWGDNTTAFTVLVGVEQAFRNRGIGSLLLEEAEKFGTAHGAKTFAAGLVDDKAAVNFVLKRGYVETGREQRSQVDLASARLNSPVEFPGYEITSFDKLDSSNRDDLLFECVLESEKDIPNVEAFGLSERVGYEAMVLRNPNFLHACCSVALKDGRIVGMSTLMSANTGDLTVLETDYTGVVPGHRRLGLATELKARSLKAAQVIGANKVFTQNSFENPGILKVNRRVGFVPVYEMVEVLKEVGT